MNKITVKHLFKIFGRNPQRTFPMIDKGMSKKDIYKKTGCTIGVHNANFSVKAGKFFVIMGLSGSGKSTLVRCLNRLIEPTRGEVYVDDMDMMKIEGNRLREARRREFSMVFQHFGLLPHRTVIDNVAYGLEVQGMKKNERYQKAEEAIKLVGLDGYESSATQALSGGMQQRVGLARSLATNSEVLLMDEAFSALDPLIRTNMQDEILEIQSQMQKTIIFITHDLDEALKLGDRIAIMKEGYIEQIDTPEQILINPASEYIRSFVKNVDRSKVITARTVMRKPEIVALHKDGPAQAVRQMRKSGLATIYVVNEDRTLAGVVKIDDAVRSSKEMKDSLSDILIRDIPETSPESPLMDIFQTASETSIPIAVLNEKRHIQGIVTRASMLAAMAGEGIGQ